MTALAEFPSWELYIFLYLFGTDEDLKLYINYIIMNIGNIMILF